MENFEIFGSTKKKFFYTLSYRIFWRESRIWAYFWHFSMDKASKNHFLWVAHRKKVQKVFFALKNCVAHPKKDFFPLNFMSTPLSTEIQRTGLSYILRRFCVILTWFFVDFEKTWKKNIELVLCDDDGLGDGRWVVFKFWKKVLEVRVKDKWWVAGGTAAGGWAAGGWWT